MYNLLQIQSIIIIQKYIRRFLIFKKILIPSSYYQTKLWRKNRKWYKNGKYNECEKEQIYILNKLINLTLNKTNERLNLESITISNKLNPMKYDDGFEYTETFDGKIIKNNNIYYFNLKFICDKGGAQTRSLKRSLPFYKITIKIFIK